MRTPGLKKVCYYRGYLLKCKASIVKKVIHCFNVYVDISGHMFDKQSSAVFNLHLSILSTKLSLQKRQVHTSFLLIKRIF